jgi:hypothetical protein
MTSEETREDVPRYLLEDAFKQLESMRTRAELAESSLRVVLKERDEAEEICANSGQVVTDLEDRLLRAEEALRELREAIGEALTITRGGTVQMPISHWNRIGAALVAYFAAVSEDT